MKVSETQRYTRSEPIPVYGRTGNEIVRRGRSNLEPTLSASRIVKVEAIEEKLFALTVTSSPAKTTISPKISTIGKVSKNDYVAGNPEDAIAYVYPDAEKPTSPRRRLVIFDLQGVLVYKDEISTIRRPGVEELLSFVFDNFDVAVWTTYDDRTTKQLAKIAFGHRYACLEFIYSEAECKISLSRDRSTKVYVKELELVWEEYTYYNKDHTYLVDAFQGNVDPGDWDPTGKDNDVGVNSYLYKTLANIVNNA